MAIQHHLAQVAILAILAILGGEGTMDKDGVDKDGGKGKGGTEFFTLYDAKSITSAPDGWRVLYVDDNLVVTEIRPMAGWATWAVTDVTVDGESVTKYEAPQALEGIIVVGGWPICALELPGLFDYLRPDQPDPEIGKLAPGVEEGQRLTRAERRPRARARASR